MLLLRKYNSFLQDRVGLRGLYAWPRVGLKGAEVRLLAEGGTVKGTMSFHGSNFGDKSLDPIMSAAPAHYGPCH